ncbi:MAG TPA: DUF4286 family protein [Holophagaceae bacterium]|jgi:hypothetical protein|nr:DUF4286 family protein [Holophagaceae bacterium]
MIAYEVRVEVREDMRDAFEFYMRRKHLREILATGCFQAIHFERADECVYRSRYEAASRADLDRYLKHHAAHFRADFMVHCPEGCTVTREVLETVETFS